MHVALEILGIPTCHWFSVWINMADVIMWYEAEEANYFPMLGGPKPFGRTEFDQLLGNYGVICDAPFITFAPKLIEAYPDALVVLVERDIETWYKSFNAYRKLHFNPFLQVISNLDVGFLYQLSRTMGLVLRGYFGTSTKQGL